MFQPKPVPILPKLVKARVPVWVLAAALVAQAAIVAIGKPDEPSCFLKLQRLHHSTSVNETRGINAIKLNATSECTKEQLETRLTVRIYSLIRGKETIIFESDPTLQIADKKDRTKAYFLDFWVECKKGSTLSYRASAEGSVLLQSRNNVRISEDTGKYLAVKCESKAK